MYGGGRRYEQFYRNRYNPSPPRGSYKYGGARSSYQRTPSPPRGSYNYGGARSSYQSNPPLNAADQEKVKCVELFMALDIWDDEYKKFHKKKVRKMLELHPDKNPSKQAEWVMKEMGKCALNEEEYEAIREFARYAKKHDSSYVTRRFKEQMADVLQTEERMGRTAQNQRVQMRSTSAERKKKAREAAQAEQNRRSKVEKERLKKEKLKAESAERKAREASAERKRKEAMFSYASQAGKQKSSYNPYFDYISPERAEEEEYKGYDPKSQKSPKRSSPKQNGSIFSYSTQPLKPKSLRPEVFDYTSPSSVERAERAASAERKRRVTSKERRKSEIEAILSRAALLGEERKKAEMERAWHEQELKNIRTKLKERRGSTKDIAEKFRKASKTRKTEQHKKALDRTSKRRQELYRKKRAGVMV